MARLINNSWVAATPPAGKTITNYSLENNGVQVIEVGNVLVANGVSVGDEAINTRVRAKYNDATYGPYSNVVTIAAVSAPAPTVTSGEVGTVANNIVVLNVSLALANIKPLVSAFAIDNGGSSVAVTNIDVTTNTSQIRLTAASALSAGAQISVDYTKPVSNPIQTAAGGQLASFAQYVVTNNIVASGAINLYDFINAASSPNEVAGKLGFSSSSVQTNVANATPVTPNDGSSFIAVQSGVNTYSGGDSVFITPDLFNGVSKAGDKYDLTMKTWIPSENSNAAGQKVSFIKDSFDPAQTVNMSQTRNSWQDLILSGLTILMTGYRHNFEIHNGNDSLGTPAKYTYIDKMKLLRTHIGSMGTNLFTTTEPGGLARTGLTKTLTWVSEGTYGAVSVVQNASGPGANASETYLKVVDTGAGFNTSLILNLGSGARLIRCKIKIVGGTTQKIRLGSTYGPELTASNYLNWTDIEFTNGATGGLTINWRQAAMGLEVHLSDIELGSLIQTAV